MDDIHLALAIQSVYEDTGGNLSEDQGLLVAWERSVLQVAAGADYDSDASIVYGIGRREILRRMESN